MAGENTKLWDSVAKTDPDYTKKVSFGKRSFTAIDAYYKVRRATEMWGPMGSAWGLEECEWGAVEQETDGNRRVVELTLDAVFWFPGGKFPISSDIAYSPGGDCRKKLYTDTLTKALSYLGFSADVFLGQFDDAKYVGELRAEKRAAAQAAPEPAPERKPLDPPAASKNEGAFDKPIGFGKFKPYTWRELVAGGSDREHLIGKAKKRWCEHPAEVGGGRYSWLSWIIDQHASGESEITDQQAQRAKTCRGLIDQRADEAAV